MTRTHLLGAASAVALACLSTAGFAANTIDGGGSTLAKFDYIAEFATFNMSSPPSMFSAYIASGSTAGQNGLLNDDLTCDTNKISGNNMGACSGGTGVGQPGNKVDYGASDATLSPTQISTWSTYPLGQPAAGNLIQLPSMGVGISVPVQNSAIKNNGDLILSDSDLCGVFSGKITDFSQLSAPTGSVKPAAGTITVVVRSDGSGTSFLLTNHLSKVCTSGTSNITFTATTTFASLFSGSTLPTNFNAQSGSGAVASTLESLPSAMGYLSPDYTTVDPNSDATVNGVKSTLVVGSVLTGKTALLPTTKNITLGLSHAASGSNLTPPTNATDGANPTAYVPLIQTVKTGYAIVGYTTFDFAQCYADPTIAAGIKDFLNLHYLNSAYLTEQSNNGFVGIANSGAAKFLSVIRQHILANKNTKPAWNVDIQDKVACKGLVGR